MNGTKKKSEANFYWKKYWRKRLLLLSEFLLSTSGIILEPKKYISEEHFASICETIILTQVIHESILMLFSKVAANDLRKNSSYLSSKLSMDKKHRNLSLKNISWLKSLFYSVWADVKFYWSFQKDIYVVLDQFIRKIFRKIKNLCRVGLECEKEFIPL